MYEPDLAIVIFTKDQSSVLYVVQSFEQLPLEFSLTNNDIKSIQGDGHVRIRLLSIFCVVEDPSSQLPKAFLSISLIVISGIE
jgi:hypothetical protein